MPAQVKVRLPIPTGGMLMAVSCLSRDKARESRGGDMSALGYAFALLGLSAREASVGRIRRAARRIARRIHTGGFGGAERQALLAEVALSTYRILDPRRRRRYAERIELSLLDELEMQRALLARRPLIATEGNGPAVKSSGRQRLPTPSVGPNQERRDRNTEACQRS
ncbi:MAG: hypothetical protein KatS3mg111_2951 [Pirellulaceae bacterium]|nr:MAG: hypothetical protein KatS3mg111_2951 [Pirellulaceae bacterium]